MPPVLREQIAALSKEEKLQLVYDLCDELNEQPEEMPLPDAVLDELDRREANLAANPDSAMTSWEEVVRWVKSRHAG